MAADDRIADLDAALDALVAEAAIAPGAIPEEDLAVLRRLHDGWRAAAPDPAFVRRLGANLAARHGRAPVAGTRTGSLSLVAAPAASGERGSMPWSPPRRTRRLPATLATLAVCAILVVAALVRGDGDRRVTIPAGSVASPPVENRAVLLVIDVSGSMSYDPLGGTSKIEMAKQAARDALAQLAPGDWFGVLAFNDQQTWVVPLAPLAGKDQRQDAAAAIDGMVAEGGTEIYPALSVAIDALRDAAPAERHLVLLTDGKSRTGTPEAYQALIEPAVAGGVVISTVAIGGDADTELMQTLAELGGGRYHFADRPADIPAGVAVILGFAAATPAPESAAQGALRPDPVAVQITVDGDGLLSGDSDAEEDAIEQLAAVLAPFVEAGCRIGFVITEGSAPDVATGNRLADAVNRLLEEAFAELTEGAGYYSVANTGQPAGPVNLQVFPNAGCEVT